MVKSFKQTLIECVAILLCTVLVCSLLFSSPVFAVDDFSFQPLPYYQNTDDNTFILSNGFQVAFTYNLPICAISSGADVPVYAFGVNVNNSSNPQFLLVFSSESDTAYFSRSGIGNTSSYRGQIRSSGSSYGQSSLFYNSTTIYLSGSGATSNVPLFDSLNEGLAAVRDYIDNGGSSETSPIYDDLPTFNIQRGYAAYIDFGADWQGRSIGGTFTSTFPQYSSLVTGDWDSTDNRRYFWTDSLPSNTSFSSNVGNAIDWTKVEPFDILKRSKRGIWFIQSNTPQNRYLVIVNPNMWRYGQNASSDTLNSSITVSDLDGSTGDVKFYALNQTFNDEGTLVSSTNDDSGNNRTGAYDPDTGTFNITDPQGNISEQVPGGSSDTPEIMSITDYIQQIGSILSNFSNNLIQLIQKPISHIGTLIAGGSEFMASLRGLYSWLPVDIQSIIISALTVIIGIGVFKVFL